MRLFHEASAQEVRDADGLDRLLTEAMAATRDQDVTMRTVMARLPSRQSLERVDCSVQPSVDRQTRQALATCRFIAHGDHLVFLGRPGTGKTHLAPGGMHAAP